MERQRVRLDLLVESVIPETVGLDREYGDGDPVVVADPRLLSVAVRNLVSNARHHGGPRDSDIRVTVEDGQVRVDDRGPGFPEGVIMALGLGDAPVPSRQGVGIGLSIVQMIAQLHGGELLLENPVGGGARATLRF